MIKFLLYKIVPFEISLVILSAIFFVINRILNSLFNKSLLGPKFELLNIYLLATFSLQYSFKIGIVTPSTINSMIQ